ncbi:DNA end-binding protein Ku [Paenibacillus algorifonticola]|uniref:Non-homologous end joining protein Ku n=1 Tax=Paenibacillus algorifonticola TaxID=684063 RepID=A0A1I2BU19_9BACL|nr:Ku protein [Paenibacillus algorifonticola]SFE59602.1 DNA end-binding protein Ku [Paenibacillus algorifonticola]
MHTVWKGAISFGLVHVPVKMHSATEDKDISFRSLHKECGMPINYAKTCRHCNKEIGPDEIVKGFEYEAGKFVIVKEEELDAIKPESAKSIQILDFVDLSEIDPVYYQKAYYLSPDMAGAGAYSLLLEAIKQTGKIGIAKISIRSKSSLAAVRVVGNCLCLETMFFPDEIRALSQVPNIPVQTTVNEKELDMAKMLVEQLSEPFDPAKYTDDYRIALTELIQQKIAGQSVDIVAAPEAKGRNNVIDLMAALQASLDATKAATPPSAPAPKKKRTSKAKGNVS